MKDLPYDDSNPKDILRYSERLVGTSFYDILKINHEGLVLEEKVNYYDNPRGKGSLGNLLEEEYFYYKANSLSEADFIDANVELKVTPYEKNNKGYRAGERLVLSMIPNNEPLFPEFIGSHLEQKINKMLMIWYLRNKSMNRTSYSIDFVNLYDIHSEICRKDLEIICEDYIKIAKKVIEGKAHELSEGDTRYLGACTKGSTAEKSLQPQFYNSSILAKRRAFSFKQSYMTYILNNYVLPGLMNYDSIFNEEELLGTDFDCEVIKKIDQYVDKGEEDLINEFNLEKKAKPKQLNKILVYRMLGVNTDNAEEFSKANIVVKTIRVKKNGLPKESMSFPKIRIKDFVTQNFEESEEYRFFSETRFLFVVFKEDDNNKFILKGSKFWNMPITELETIGKKEWEEYKDKFISGVHFEVTKNKENKIIIKNDLPKKKDHTIFHMRPHAGKSAYLINGIKYGNGQSSDMDLLPNGDKMTSQCFWLNNDYIAKIIQDI